MKDMIDEITHHRVRNRPWRAALIALLLITPLVTAGCSRPARPLAPVRSPLAINAYDPTPAGTVVSLPSEPDPFAPRRLELLHRYEGRPFETLTDDELRDMMHILARPPDVLSRR